VRYFNPAPYPAHPTEHALISLRALNRLRVSEATGADIGALGIERGHRTLMVTRKGGKVVTIPLAPRTARAIDLAIGERSEGSTSLAWPRPTPGETTRFPRQALSGICHLPATDSAPAQPACRDGRPHQLGTPLHTL
jgi:integrase